VVVDANPVVLDTTPSFVLVVVDTTSDDVTTLLEPPSSR
jgi:hypothetical protein